MKKIIIILRLSLQLELPKGDHCWGIIIPQTSYFYPPLTIDVTVADPGGDTGVGTPLPQVLILHVLEKNGKTCNLGNF